MKHDLDLGDGHYLDWLWGAEVNQNFDGSIVEVDHRPVGAIISGDACRVRHQYGRGAVIFDLPEAQRYSTGRTWTVNSWLPLTLSPSLLCRCGDHGRITDGKWVRA